jgi:hypothetical protein
LKLTFPIIVKLFAMQQHKPIWRNKAEAASQFGAMKKVDR